MARPYLYFLILIEFKQRSLEKILPFKVKHHGYPSPPPKLCGVEVVREVVPLTPVISEGEE